MSQPIALKAASTAALPDAGGGGSGAEVQGRPTMKKAELALYDPAPAPGGGKPGAFREAIAFQFNPKEVSIQKAAKWERQPAKKAQTAGPPEFKGADPCKLTVEMFFDTTDSADGSVVGTVEKLFSCCVPTPDSLGKDKPTPPIVVLRWGTITSFPGFVTSVSAKYTLFRPDGLPVRALCSVSIDEMPGEPFRQNPTSGGPAVQRVHRTVAGDTLASVAYAEYGDPTAWRPLARFNAVDDPLRVAPGTTLLLPTAAELGVRP